MHNAKEIKKYCNYHGYTDVEPYEVVRVISDKTVEIRPMAHGQNKANMEWVSGGFAGHCINNHAQHYDYYPNPDAKTIRVRWSEKFQCWKKGSLKFTMADEPRYFYDYNF